MYFVCFQTKSSKRVHSLMRDRRDRRMNASSIGPGIASMTSQNGGQDGRHGSNPSPDKGYDL